MTVHHDEAWWAKPQSERGHRCGDHKGRNGDWHRNRAKQRCATEIPQHSVACKFHGGASPQVKAKAKERAKQHAALEAVATYGLPQDIDPAEALLQELARTQGHVLWLAMQVRQLEQDKLVFGTTKLVQMPDGDRVVTLEAAVNTWLQLYQAERRHLMQVAKAAADAGVQERLTVLAESQIDQLAALVTGLLSDLGHSMDDPKVAQVVRLRLEGAG